ASGNPQITFGIDPSEGFTMIIATYQRDLLLPPLIKHLTSTPPPSLRQIVIVWQNVDLPLPDFLSPQSLGEYSTSGVAVTVRKSWKNSMNERFRPILDWGHEIATNSVFIMDDDVVLRKGALEWGYQQFVESGRKRIVGFSPREFERGEKEGEWKYLTKPTSTYSMILSNAAFFDKSWLEKYWEDSNEMTSLRNYVDGVFNCDDLLINFLVSNLTHSPPLLLQPSTPLRTIPTEGGLWNRVVSPSSSPSSTGSAAPETITTSPPRPEHFSTRKECLAHYFSHFSQFAPPSSSSSSQRDHYPLIKTSTSISQEVQDHSRWMFENEMWETVVWEKPDDGSNDESVEEEEPLSEEEEKMLDNGDYESFLQGLSDEEIDELMQSLEEEVHELGGEEPEKEGNEAAATVRHEEL
ncbi:Jip5p, partial [Sporobolomyces salmoneus]|uniref:Jip5p n=1 Tax=Sporobolomyces salmoneus TaxID=183962 RepID=UPI0031769447